MAILKSMLEENVLSKSEQAVLRMLTRCAMLNEGLIILDKLENVISLNEKATGVDFTYKEYQTQRNEGKSFLKRQIAQTLCSYRFKASVPISETTSNLAETKQ